MRLFFFWWGGRNRTVAFSSISRYNIFVKSTSETYRRVLQFFSVLKIAQYKHFWSGISYSIYSEQRIMKLVLETSQKVVATIKGIFIKHLFWMEGMKGAKRVLVYLYWSQLKIWAVGDTGDETPPFWPGKKVFLTRPSELWVFLDDWDCIFFLARK